MESVVGVVTAVTSTITGAVESESDEDSSSSLLQEMTVKLKRKRERMTSSCLTWFSISVLG